MAPVNEDESLVAIQLLREYVNAWDSYYAARQKAGLQYEDEQTPQTLSLRTVALNLMSQVEEVAIRGVIRKGLQEAPMHPISIEGVIHQYISGEFYSLSQEEAFAELQLGLIYLGQCYYPAWNRQNREESLARS